MELTLTHEQCQIVRQVNGNLPRVVDPETKRQYVLVDADAYERLQGVLGEPDPRELYHSLNRALADEGWNDPDMDDYNRYA